MGTYYEKSEKYLVLKDIANNMHGICKFKKKKTTYMTLISRQNETVTLGSPDSGAGPMAGFQS